MPSIEELERSLQRTWDHEALSVYADALIALGDPRGELIALDLAIAAGDATLEILEKRVDRIEAWLGPNMCGLELSNVRFGLIEDFVYFRSATANLHHSGVGRYLRSVAISAEAVDLPSVLANLVTEPLPWLRRLSISQSGVGPLRRTAVDAFAARTPNLTELILKGDHVIVTPGHPNVTTLRISGRSSIVVGPESMPSVAEIDLAFESYGRRTQRNGIDDLPRLAGLVNPRAFPGIRRLDLSRNKFVYPTDHACNVGVFPLIEAIESPERITHFRLPSLRNADDVAGVRALLESDLNRTVEVVRMYAGADQFMDGLEDLRLSLPPPRPWPAPDTVSGREALTIKVPNERYGDDVALSPWVETLERIFDGLADEPRAAWIQLWRFLDDLAWDTPTEDMELPFPAPTLLSALETMDDDRSLAVRKKLQALTPRELANTEVAIKRYWGW